MPQAATPRYHRRMPAPVEQLRAAVTAGLGEHHNLRGVCNLRFRDEPSLDFSLVLEPGRVAFDSTLPASADATLTFFAGGLDSLLKRDRHIDVRSPAMAQWVSLTGDVSSPRTPCCSCSRSRRKAPSSCSARSSIARGRTPAIHGLKTLERIPKARA